VIPKEKVEDVIVVTARSKNQFQIQLRQVINTFGMDRIKIIGSGVQHIRQAINLHAIIVVKEKSDTRKKVSTASNG